MHKVSEEHRGNPTLVSGGQEEEGERGGSREHDLPNLGRLPTLPPSLPTLPPCLLLSALHSC